jgi:Replication-relaxation
VIRQTGNPDKQGPMRSSQESGRAPRVSAERLSELARHVTERDREIALCLYEQQLLATDQLTLLFFSSKRRAQDRLLFLYRQRVLDRFYPPSRFGAGKPQAHWLLDEAGAQLVAAALGVERKRLGWQRRDDWGSHRQLAHRLEVNRFVTDLIAATLLDAMLAVRAWSGPRAATERLERRVRPDARLLLQTAVGADIECLIEWDRATEPAERLAEKLHRYRIAERKLRYHDREPRSILFVVPGHGRLETLRCLPAPCSDESSTARERWPVFATTVAALRRDGALARVWQPISRTGEPPRALNELPARSDLRAADPRIALGRRWRHDQPDFWERLSPLGIIHRDLRSSTIDGSMDDRENDVEEEPWQ